MSTYRSPLAASLIIHIGAAIALFTIAAVPISKTPVRKYAVIYMRPISIHRMQKAPSGGGGGGRAEFPVGRGRPPKPSPRPFTPPLLLATAREPILPMPPALAAAPDSSMVNLPQWGDPLSSSLLPSSGPGDGGGMGSGHGPGVGSGTGHGGAGGSGRSLSSGVSDPELLYKVEPEFSEEARRAKYSGTVLLLVDVDATGHAVNVRIAKGLGLGLDEKAVEAVSRWRFRPGRKNGKPVVVPASIEVNFRLL